MVSIVGPEPTDVRSTRAEPAIRNLIFYKIYDIIFIESKGRNIARSYSSVRLEQGQEHPRTLTWLLLTYDGSRCKSDNFSSFKMVVLTTVRYSQYDQ